MREFDYSHISNELRDNDVCNLISSIREYRGKQALFISAKPDVLKTLLEIAKIQSTAASNKIERATAAWPATENVRRFAIYSTKGKAGNIYPFSADIASLPERFHITFK